MDLLEYVEAEARASAEFQIACRDVVLKEANTTVAGLFAGGVGALAYAVSLSEKPAMMWAAWGMAASSVYLFVLALLTVVFCLRTQNVWPPANDPGLLLDAEELKEDGTSVGGLASLRLANLRSKQRSIENNRVINAGVARWLDCLRLWAVLVPVVFIAAAAAAVC